MSARGSWFFFLLSGGRWEIGNDGWRGLNFQTNSIAGSLMIWSGLVLSMFISHLRAYCCDDFFLGKLGLDRLIDFLVGVGWLID